MKSLLQYYAHLLSLKKFTNALKNISSFYLSRLTGGYFVWGKPFSFFIEPTNLCNLRCTECPVGLKLLKRPQGLLDFDRYKKIIDDISGHAWQLLIYYQGESTIHPQLIPMIEYAYRHKIYTELSTNGVRLGNSKFCRELAESHLSKLIISLDGATEETYKIYRQDGLFHRVVAGTRNFVKIRNSLKKRYPRTVIQFLVMRHNEHEMAAIKKLGKELGVDAVVYKSPQIYDFENAEDILPQNPRFRRYEKENGKYRLKGTYSGYCRKLWFGSVITQDATVIPCCFDKDADYPLGYLNQTDFGTIWNAAAYHRFRRTVVGNRNRVPMCRNCSEGLKTFFK